MFQAIESVLNLAEGVLAEKAKADNVQSIPESFKRKFYTILRVSILERCPMGYQVRAVVLDLPLKLPANQPRSWPVL